MKLWVDDARPAPEGWFRAFNYDQARSLLISYNWDEVSLDHDLGSEKTGYDLLMLIVERKERHGIKAPKVSIHSANPVGVERMQGVIDRYLKEKTNEAG